MSKTHVTYSGYLKPNKTITPEFLSLRGYCYFDRKYIPHNMQGLYLRVMYLGVYFYRNAYGVHSLKGGAYRINPFSCVFLRRISGSLVR